MDLHSLRWRLVNKPGSWGFKQREQRSRWLAETFPDLEQMRSYFPDSTLRAEWAAGLTKSLIAYRTA